jgi:hypothetical protein
MREYKGGAMNEAETREFITRQFGFGAAGTPVPEVDPADTRAIYDYQRELLKDCPSGCFTGMEIYKQICKPGSDVMATVYRMQQFGVLKMVVSQLSESAHESVDEFKRLVPLLDEHPDAVCRVTATLPMEWMGVGVPHKGLPFDLNEYLRRIEEAA